MEKYNSAKTRGHSHIKLQSFETPDLTIDTLSWGQWKSETDSESVTVTDTLRDNMNEMTVTGIISPAKQNYIFPFNERMGVAPPVPGAKLGKDLKGNPAWFIPDPDRAGKYLQIQISKKVIS